MHPSRFEPSLDFILLMRLEQDCDDHIHNLTYRVSERLDSGGTSLPDFRQSVSRSTRIQRLFLPAGTETNDYQDCHRANGCK